MSFRMKDKLSQLVVLNDKPTYADVKFVRQSGGTRKGRVYQGDNVFKVVLENNVWYQEKAA